MRKTGAGPSLFLAARRAFGKGMASVLGAVNGLLERLAMVTFYPLAAYPVSRALTKKNLAENLPQSPAGRLVLRQEAAEVCGMRCGKSNVGRVGCGPVSVYNALVLLGLGGPDADARTGTERAAGHAGRAGSGGASQAQTAALAGVIRTFEESRALVLGGRAGATPYALRRVLRQYDLAARPAHSLAALERMMPPGGVAILLIWNDRSRIARGAHYFAVQRMANGQGFTGYNCGAQPSPALAGLVGSGRFAAGYLVQRP